MEDDQEEHTSQIDENGNEYLLVPAQCIKS